MIIEAMFPESHLKLLKKSKIVILPSHFRRLSASDPCRPCDPLQSTPFPRRISFASHAPCGPGSPCSVAF